MKSTGSPNINWVLIVCAGILLAISFSALKRSAIRGPLCGVFYVVCQGIVALPFLGYIVAKSTKLVSPQVGTTIGLGATAIALIGIYFWQPYLSAHFEKEFGGEKIKLQWIFCAASLGFIGMVAAFHEFSRLISFGDIGVLKVAIAGAGLIIVQNLGMNLLAFTIDFQWDYVPYVDRPSKWQCLSFVLISVGLMLSAIQKDPKEYLEYAAREIKSKTPPPRSVEVASEKEVVLVK